MRKEQPPRPATHRSVAERFRLEIDKAMAAGVPRADLTLELTLTDVSHLRRDRSLAVDDLSFAGGVMKFLGVVVHEGGVTASKLNAPTDA